MKKAARITVGILSALAMLFPFSARAITAPSFTSCPAPGGTIIASYSDGTHGVPGDVNTYTGSDVVYQLNESQVVQCLCPTDTQGIQTWWWKASNLSETDRELLKSQGWIFIPNGALWGLDETEYYAKNITYSCTTGTGGGSGSGSSSSDSSSGGIGGVSTGQVLGAYAATGSVELIALYGVAAISLLGLSWILTKFTR